VTHPHPSLTTDVDAPRRRLLVDGVEVEARVDVELLDGVLVPRLAELAQQPRRHHRTFAFLVAPPGTGKSTLAALLRERAQHLDLDTAGIDGFHHPQAYLDSHHVDLATGRTLLSSVKGAPESFDVAGLRRRLEAARDHDVTWPGYDRRLHDVVEQGHRLTAGLVLLEGNWLLLDEPGWRDLADFSELTIFIEADPVRLRERLIERKVRGGMSRRDAEAFHRRSDGPNVARVLNHSDRSRVDLLLHLTHDGTIRSGGSR
jgi:pantothenate kinase